jgi:hypothetical protein
LPTPVSEEEADAMIRSHFLKKIRLFSNSKMNTCSFHLRAVGFSYVFEAVRIRVKNVVLLYSKVGSKFYPRPQQMMQLHESMISTLEKRNYITAEENLFIYFKSTAIYKPINILLHERKRGKYSRAVLFFRDGFSASLIHGND